jgi:hypothetical protein
MKTMVWRLFQSFISTIVISAMVLGQSRAKEPDINTVLQRVGERVKTHYLDLQRLAWIDTVRQQSLKEDRTPQGNARSLVYEMTIRLDQAIPRPNIPPPLPPFFTKELGELISIDGASIQKGDRPELTDSKPGDIGLLWILLWAPKREDHNYRFTYAGQADLEGRKTLLVDIAYPPKGFPVGPMETMMVGDTNRVPHVVWQGDSFTAWVQQTGRIWIDPDTYDVLRLEARTKPFEFESPKERVKLKFEFELTARFKSMTFDNPKQTFRVPESIETVRTIKGRQPPVLRTLHTFSDYKRFSADVKVTSPEIR